MTKEEAPDAAPIDISAESRGSAVVRLKWRAPPKSNWNGELKGYNIGHRSMGEGDDDGEPSNDLAQVQRLYTFNRVAFADLPNGDDYQQEYILTGLAKASTYSIIIQAYNSAGNGPFSQQLIASTSTNGMPNSSVRFCCKLANRSSARNAKPCLASVRNGLCASFRITDQETNQFVFSLLSLTIAVSASRPRLTQTLRPHLPSG